MSTAADKRNQLSSKLSEVREKVIADGLTEKEWHSCVLKSLATIKVDKSYGKAKGDQKQFWLILSSSIVVLVALAYYFTMDRCIIGNSVVMMEIARPAVSCDVCKALDSVPTVDGTTFSKEEFLSNFAYNGVPLLVKGGAANWTALNVFNFTYLKHLYEETDGALEAVENECQFFPYKTDFLSLAEVFNMSDAQSRFEPGEKYWYVGWSNCHPTVAKELRKHYTRPRFLPDDSESSNLDWLFMGGFGGGANVHIDYVQRPSWQAMIAGRKSWKIVPSPECDTVCNTLNATMEKGDISKPLGVNYSVLKFVNEIYLN